jgi:hypothetical protein
MPENECLDIFAETSYLNPHRDIDLYHFANNCKNIQKTLENIRYHDIDVRSIYDINKQLHKYPLTEILDRPLFRRTLIQLDPTHIIEFFLTGDMKLFGEYNKFMSELYVVAPDVDPSSYEKWGVIYAEMITRRISKLAHNYDRFKEAMYKTIQSNKTHILVRLPMDIYFLMRLFTRFHNKRMTDSSVCKTDIKNCIIYSGQAHSYFYIEFLNNYFGTEPDYVSETFNYQCINLPTKFTHVPYDAKNIMERMSELSLSESLKRKSSERESPKQNVLRLKLSEE